MDRHESIRGRAIWTFVAVVCAGLLALLILRTRERRNEQDKQVIDPSSESPSNLAAADYSAGGAETIPVQGPNRVSELPKGTGLVGHVVAGSELVADARVTLLLLTDEDLDWEGAWYGEDWGTLERESRSTRTGQGGRFEFEMPPRAPQGAILWASHPGHSAGILVLGSDRDSWPRDARIALGPAPVIEVSVRDTEGRVVSGALVQQFGMTSRSASKTIGVFGEEQARRLLQTDQTTEVDGNAVFSALPGEQVFVASRGSERSLPWRGPPQQRVVLTLHPTFEVEGRVSMPSWEHLNYVGERRLSIAAQTRNLWRTLHTVRSVENGPFGPIVLPLVEVDRYRIRLEGSPIIPAEAFFEPPKAGAKLSLELATNIGVNVWFHVSDKENQLINEAVVKVLWQTPERPDHWNFVERRCNERGNINVWSLPPGSMMYEASAPGFVPYKSGVDATKIYEANTVTVILERAGRLRGRVTHGGKPLRDFEILVWQPALGNTPISTALFDREDGRFELDTVPVGEFWVTASSGEFTGGEPLQVTCPPGGVAEVEIDLPSGLIGRGIIVDEATDDPIGEAGVQVFVMGGIEPIARWGLPIPVASDGSFEIKGFVPGQNVLRAQAPGYSQSLLTRRANPGDEIDWGTILLARNQDLRVEIERGDTANEVQVSAQGAQALPTMSFPQDNRLTFGDVSSGAYIFNFEEDSGTSTFCAVEFASGRDWVLAERIDGPNHLSVVVEGNKDGPAPATVQVAYTSSQGFRHLRSRLLDNKSAEFRGIDSERVTVELFDDMAGSMATSSGAFVGGELHLVLSIGGDAFDLRVVDAKGEPLPGVRVLMVDPEQSGFARRAGTDAEGKCQINGVPPRQVLVHLEHPTKGSHYGLRCDGSAGAAEFVLDPRGTLDLLVVDGEQPLGDVDCTLIDFDGSALRLAARTNPSGRTVIDAIAVAPYSLHFQRSDCWETTATVEAKLGGDPTPVQMRRLADMELHVVAVSGLPVSGLPIELRSIEFESDVARWIEAGLVRSEGLSTDLAGEIRIERLPRGPYLWRVTPPGREPLEGRIELEPGKNPPVRIFLPE